MNEYSVDAKDMINVADTIREKANITEQLSFPEGWKDAIRGIKTGVELNFEVVGGTAQPENPKENTIWVNTDQEITGWSFSSSAPNSPVDGMVWIRPLSGFASINAVKKNEIIVPLGEVSRYASGSWTHMEAWYFDGEQWHELSSRTYLIYRNNLCEGITGGWNCIGIRFNSAGETTAAPTFTVDEDSVIVTDAAQRGGVFVTINKVDLTPYNALKILCNSNYGSYHTIRVWSSLTGTYQDSNCSAYTYINTIGLAERTLDVSALKGSYYVGVGSNNDGSVAQVTDIFAIWLE